MTPNELKTRHGKTVVKILRRARKVLKDRRSDGFVCIAVQIAADELYAPIVGIRLADVISDSIKPNSIVRHWLVDSGYATDNETTIENMLEYRLRWIDWMIEGYSK